MTSEEAQVLHQRDTERIKDLTDKLHMTQNMLYDSTKDYLDLKYEFRAKEREWMAEKDQLLQQLDFIRQQMDISEGIDPDIGMGFTDDTPTRYIHVYMYMIEMVTVPLLIIHMYMQTYVCSIVVLTQVLVAWKYTVSVTGVQSHNIIIQCLVSVLRERREKIVRSSQCNWDSYSGLQTLVGCSFQHVQCTYYMYITYITLLSMLAHQYSNLLSLDVVWLHSSNFNYN